jgi:hypothetical protein
LAIVASTYTTFLNFPRYQIPLKIRGKKEKKCEIRKKIRRTGRFSYMYIYIFFGMSGCAALCVVINDGVVVAGADKKGKITVKAVKISFFFDVRGRKNPSLNKPQLNSLQTTIRHYNQHACLKLIEEHKSGYLVWHASSKTPSRII